MKCQVAAIQWGGGGRGSSSNFRSTPEAVAIQWGGGVVAEFLRDLRKPARFQWGRGSTIHFSFMGPFYIFGILKMEAPFFNLGIFKRGGTLFYIFGIFKRGGPGPPGPPPELATGVNDKTVLFRYT